MTTYLGKSCSFGLPREPFVNCGQFMYFGFEGRMWDLIVSVPDHCLSNYFIWATTWQNQQTECAPSEDSDQPGHPPSLIRVFAVRSMGSEGPSVSSCAQRRLWSDSADAEADLSLRWAHTHFVGFVTSRLIFLMTLTLRRLILYE